MEYKKFQLVLNLVEYQTRQPFIEKLVSYEPHCKLTVSQLGQEVTRLCNEANCFEYEIFYENLGIFHAPLPSGIQSKPFEIFQRIYDRNKAQIRITKLLITSDVKTPGEFPDVLHHVVCYKIFWDEYFSAFPAGTFLLHINN